MNDSSDEYRVGRGQPPRETRWKKGQSGNPRRRRTKTPEGTVATIDRLLVAPVPITMDGEAKTVTALEAIMCQLVLKGLSGNGRARRTLLKYVEFASLNSKKLLKLAFVESDYTRAFARGSSGANDG
jgi:hypothetical protein